MRNGDATAYPGRSEFFPLEKVGRDLIDRQAETISGFGREFLQQQRLVGGSKVDHYVSCRQQIGAFPGRSPPAPRYNPCYASVQPMIRTSRAPLSAHLLPPPT